MLIKHIFQNLSLRGHSFIHLFVQSFIHLSGHSFVRSFIRSVICSIIHSFARSVSLPCGGFPMEDAPNERTTQHVFAFLLMRSPTPFAVGFTNAGSLRISFFPNSFPRGVGISRAFPCPRHIFQFFWMFRKDTTIS